MTVQVRNNLNTIPFVRYGVAGNDTDATILQDAGRSSDLARFTVMGKALVAAGTATANAGNTGNGTFTAYALAAGPIPLVGSYNLECVAAIAHGGIFKLEDPNGVVVATNLTMNPGAGLATVFTAAGLTITVTDGSTDFIVGDKAALTVTAVNKYLPLDIEQVDGREIPKGIFMGDAIAAADIVAGDVVDQLIMITGNVYVDENQVVLENSLTLDTALPSGDTIREALMKLGIIAEDSIDISGYENT